MNWQLLETAHSTLRVYCWAKEASVRPSTCAHPPTTSPANKPDTCLRQAGQPAGQRGVLAGPTDGTDATMMCREAKVQGNGPRSSRLRSTSRWKREQMRSIPERTSWRNTPLEPRRLRSPQEVDVFFVTRNFCDGKQTKFVRYDVSDNKIIGVISVHQ